MASTQTPSTVLHADQEHSGLRTAVFVTLFISLVLAFFLIRAWVSSLESLADFSFVLACGGAFPAALLIVWLAERLMKQYWPSGRTVALTVNGVQITDEEDQTLQFSQDSAVEPLFWFFDLRGWQRGGRERRVPRNWLCLAVELKTGKAQKIVYTYLSQGKARKWLESKHKNRFHEIFPRDVYDNSIKSRLMGPSRPEIPSAVLTSKDGSYWLAERRRWTEGFELPPREFEQFMQHIQTTLKL